MGDVVNLRQARKARVRAAAAAKADANRALHGRTLADRKRDRAAADAAKRTLDGARLDDGLPQ